MKEIICRWFQSEKFFLEIIERFETELRLPILTNSNLNFKLHLQFIFKMKIKLKSQ